jgi:hypothetical protein
MAQNAGETATRRPGARSRNTTFAMPALKAHVKGGRLVFDEPTDWPEGAGLEIAVLGDLSAEVRAELHASPDRALDDSYARRRTDARVYLAQHRAGRERRPI